MAVIIPRHIPRLEDIEKFAQVIPEIEPVAVEALLTLLRLSSGIASSAERYFSEHSLSEGRFTILMMLRRAQFLENLDSLSPAELAERTGVTRATVSGLLDKLEKDDLISRETFKEDRRKISVKLLPAGEKRLADALPGHFSRVSTLLSGLTTKEKKQLTALLKTIWKTLAEVEPSEA
ncbi:MarR family transcriptional regulator [Oligoflexia bacterium]|nr:MarR family transcriptional regulator [Oligoflexia bacterium]